jgi:hypothetical protein
MSASLNRVSKEEVLGSVIETVATLEPVAVVVVIDGCESMVPAATTKKMAVATALRSIFNLLDETMITAWPE